jgi:hypothetical protein
MVLSYGVRFIDMDDNLVYNGRRYKYIDTNLLYARIQDGEQKILHIPLMDLHGLIPPDNIRSVQ